MIRDKRRQSTSDSLILDCLPLVACSIEFVCVNYNQIESNWELTNGMVMKIIKVNGLKVVDFYRYIFSTLELL